VLQRAGRETVRRVLWLGVIALALAPATARGGEVHVGGHGQFDIRYLRLADREPGPVEGYDHLGDTGMRLRAFVGHERVQLALGLDFHIGGTHPEGFAHAAHIHPLGIAVADGDGLRLSVTVAIGVDGVTGDRLPTAMRLPADFLFEVPLGDCIKLELGGELAWLPLEEGRQSGSRLLDGVDETALAVRVRIDRRYDRWAASNGYFLGLELGERLRGAHLGVAIGYAFQGATTF
jgi:hypothetical protein